MKILLVEDNDVLQRTITRMLRRTFDDVSVVAVDSADDAIDSLRGATLDQAYDFIISDFNLRGHRNGGDVLAWVQQHASYLETRFLFLSSDSVAVEKHHKPYVLKPCDASQLQAAIQAVLNDSRS